MCVCVCVCERERDRERERESWRGFLPPPVLTGPPDWPQSCCGNNCLLSGWVFGEDSKGAQAVLGSQRLPEGRRTKAGERRHC